MQAIILAAGMGKRLGELTRDNTKCMIKVNGERMIDRTLTMLSHLNLTRVVIVIGYCGDNLRNYVGKEYKGLKIQYIENPIYDKTNNIYSLALAKKELQEDDTLLLESDIIFEESLLTKLINDPFPNLALVDKYQTWMDGTMVRIDEFNNIVNFVPKKAFKYSDVDSYYKTVNIYKFSKDFLKNEYVPFLDAYTKALGNNEYYEQVLRVITLLNTDEELKALPLNGEKWYEIDDIQDLDIAETLFSSKKELMHRYNMRYGGHWRFPRLLDFCYLVNPYFPPKRMRDEITANFDALLTEYPSGMYVNSLLAGKYFGIKQDYTVVGNGASELIKSLMSKLTGPIGITFPTFEEYPHRREQDEIIAFNPDNDDLSYCISDLEDFYQDKSVQSILLVNPDNPSGNFIPLADIIQFASWCKDRAITLIVDESFVDFTEDYQHNSLFNNTILESNPNLIVMKSISKSYGVPGLRLGILASSDVDLIKWMKKDVSIWNINSFAEFYLQIYGKYTSDYSKACERFIAERNRFYSELQKIQGIRVIPSQANYFLVKINPPYTSGKLTEVLLEKYNILIKDCDSKTGLKGRNYVRIAVRDQKDDDQLVKALTEILS